MTRRRMLLGRLAGVCLSAALCLGTAQGAVYDASTGYVTLLVNGSTATDSPMSTTKAEDSASTASNRKYFWSDHLPMHAGTNYYVNTWFRTVIETTATTSNHHVFPGGKFVCGPKSSVQWKTFAPSSYEFANEGALVYGGSIWKVNQSIVRPVVVRGRVELTESSSAAPFNLQPWGADPAYVEGLGIDMEATVVANASQWMQVQANTSAANPRRGFVRLLGDMSQFLGTVGVASNRLFVCNETLANAKLVSVIRCGDLFTGAADGATGAVSKVTVDATSSIGAAASNTLVAANLTLANGSAVRFGWNGTSAGCVEVTNAFAAAGTIGVAPADPVDPNTLTNGPARVAVLKVKGANAFSVNQFARVPTIAWYVSNEASAVVPDDFPGLTFEVENEDGWTVLYVTLNQVVTQVVDNSGADNASKFHQAATWSNNKTPAQNAGADFYSNVGCYLPPTGVPETEVYHFPGRSMTVRKTLTFSSRGIIDFDQLNIYTGSTGTQTMRAWVFGLQVFTGNLRLVGNNDYLFTLGNNTTQRWESAISGHCNVIVGIRKPDANSQGGKEKCCEFGLTGDNTNFTGKWTVRHNSSDIENPTQFMMFAVCESRNLGAPFKTYQYDALTIKNWQALKPGRAESVLDDMTRGINFAGGNAQVVAPEGRTLALKCPITLSGVLHKSGAGTLALGGTVKPKFCGAAQSTTPLAGTNGLVVAEGWIKPLSTNGVDGLAVEFAGGGIKLDRAPADAGVAAYGFWNTKWSAPFARAEGVTAKVPVMVDMGELTDMPSPISRYAICTVAADKAAGVKGMLAVQKPFKGYVTGVEERANADGTVTLLAMVRYGGLTMFIR